MRTTMQDGALQIRRILDHGSSVHGLSEVLTCTGEGLVRTSFAQIAREAAQLAHGLRDLGVYDDDRVATFMWNNAEHVAAYFAVPCMGSVVHPLNIRLAPEQVAYTANQMRDLVVIVDGSLLAEFAKVVPLLTTVRHVVVKGPGDVGVLPPSRMSVHSYDTLLEGRPTNYEWPEVDERRPAAICCTSGTTGEPKGVVYSHRSIYIHSMALALPDAFGLSASERVLAIVPQFHVLAWGLPYTAFFTGHSLAMPDRFLAPEPLARFIAEARPTKGAGVPTVWQGLLRHLDENPGVDVNSLREGFVGGSACPRSLMTAFQERHGITLIEAWGMTEMSPLGTVARPPAHARGDAAWWYRSTQGRLIGTVEARLIGANGEVVPHDGESIGEVEVRGPHITGGYHAEGKAGQIHDGWFRTGDVGSITTDGYLRLTDRAKDVIKSGGEWISSIRLENHLMGHPEVSEACVIGVLDDRWGERPLAVVVGRADGHPSAEELRSYLAERVPRWQLPERWAFVSAIPKTSTGKHDKKLVRKEHSDGRLAVQLETGPVG
jgi:fatty-acyl-CoA synthase